MAPAANIVVLCATPIPANYYRGHPHGIATLAGLPGVSVISVSYGWFLDCLGQRGPGAELGQHDHPAGAGRQPGRERLRRLGRQRGGLGLIYPSASPEVVSVGGTSLYLNANNTYNSEIGWGFPGDPYYGSGGGYSQAFPIPSYQQTDGFAGNNGPRTNPDVAADADPNTGVAVYDPYDFGTATPWVQVGGTSVATPLWAGMASIADQGRVLAGGSPLGSTAMLTDLYNLDNIAPGDFHDITTGNNGYPAGPGYDLVTGLGSPVANLLIPDLSAYGLASQSTIATQPPPTVVQGDPFGIVAQATDSLGIPDPTYTGTATLSLLSGPAGATFTPVTVPVSDGLAVFAGLSLSQLSNGTDYVFQVSISGADVRDHRPRRRGRPDRRGEQLLSAAVRHAAPTPATASATRSSSADFDGSPTSVITLSISTLPYDITTGELALFNGASGTKTIDVVGQGESNSVIDAGGIEPGLRDLSATRASR